LATPFRISDDNREVYEIAKFKFSLGGGQLVGTVRAAGPEAKCLKGQRADLS